MVQDPIESSMQDLRLGEYDLILVDHSSVTIPALDDLFVGKNVV